MEKTIFHNTHIVAGVNNFEFSCQLKKGESFCTPAFCIGYSDGGFGEMSRRLHRFENTCIIPSGLRRVLYNRWEATAFAVEVEKQKRLAKKAAAMGVELFVVDDGGFGERDSDRAGLGDWYVNPGKFPNGLEELIDYVDGLKMDFGILIEPEAVNPDSRLYREHLDWIYRYENLEPMQARNQYVLNITLPQVQEYLKNVFDSLFGNHSITFLKWDMNRAVSDLGGGPESDDREPGYRNALALYGLWRYLREKFPKVELETCAGGGRVDLGILSLADECWPSDNTDPYDRLFIQEGFSLFYPPKAMMCWVTDTNSGSGRARSGVYVPQRHVRGPWDQFGYFPPFRTGNGGVRPVYRRI